ncbi:hypothetical protein FVEG_11015 [Fusarium verticillioides 7600]|uniref:Uncharacterized protein n=2 Tax=Gibberella moniliformis (strain M3125 / FGSC 7600) TaxID=334819 RepID=W7N6H1_GIBM7|nr:hypothetical protein FVEG_11015 [Fusarium verticillioides 7600]EWG52222.1 hypothetical protein FVEG_11015 [Fusarium verticillioides 7600]
MSLNSSWEKCATEFDPDPDIAGIGVVTAFITASCLAIISISLYLAIASSGVNVIEVGGARPPPRLGFVESVNPIDDWVRRNVSDPFVRLLVRSRWIRAHIYQLQRGLYSFVITLADTQIITGMAILCTVIIELHRKEISVYHFMTATNLAWLTSGVHILTLYAIRVETHGGLGSKAVHYQLNDRALYKKDQLTSSLGADMTCRIFAMLVLAALLLYCTWINGAGEWDNYDERLASCAIGMKKAGSPLSWMIASYVLLIQGYTIQCLSLWPTVSIWWTNKIKVLGSDDRVLGAPKNGQKRRWWRLIVMPLYYAFNSEALGVLLFDGVLWFGLGVWWIQAERIYVLGAWEGMESESDIEGVSQLLCLLILVVPFLQAMRTYHDHSRTYPQELGLLRGQGAYDSGQTSQEVLARGNGVDSDGIETPIRLGSVTRTAYPV